MADFRLGRGVLEIIANSTGLRQEISRAIDAASKNLKIVLPVSVKTTGLRSEATKAVKTATSGLTITLPIAIDSSRLRQEISRAVEVASKNLKIPLPVTVDASKLRQEINRAVKAAASGLKIPLPITAKATGLRSEVNKAAKAATSGLNIPLPISAKTTGLRGEVSKATKTATSGLDIPLPISAKTTGLRSEANKAVKAATSGLDIPLPISAKTTGLRGEVNKAAKAATSGLNIPLPISAKTTGLRGETNKAVKTATSGLKIPLPVSVTTTGLRAAIRQAVQTSSTNIRIVIPIVVSSVGLRAAIRQAILVASTGQHITIPVDVDDATLRRIRSRLSSEGRDAGTGFGQGASSNIRSVLSRMDFIPDFSPRFVAIAGSIAAAILPATAAILALGSSLGLASASAAAALPAMLGLVTGAGALLLAFKGVAGALGAHKKMLDQTASSAGSNAAAEAAAAKRIESAQRSLADARRAQAKAAADSAEQIRAAQQRVIDAQARARTAQEDLTRARQEAAEEIRDYQDAVAGAALSEESAQIALARARERLVEVNKDAEASALDRREAALHVAEAELRLKEATEDNIQTQQDAAEANRRGVEGSDRVVAAKVAQRDANAGVAEAERNLTKVKQDAAERQEQASIQVARAVADLADAQRSAAQSSGAASTAAGAYQDALAKLSPAGREFVQTLIGMGGAFTQMRLAAETAVLPGFTQMLLSVKQLAPDIIGYIRGIGTEIGRGAAETAKFMATPLFRGQLATIMAENQKAFSSLADAASPLTRIFMDISVAAAPLVSRLAAAFANATQSAAAFLDLKLQTGELQKFFKDAGDEMAKWWHIATNFLTGLILLFRNAAPAGKDLATSLESISQRFKEWAGSESARASVERLMRFIASIDVGQILRVAAAASALGLALKGMAAVSGVAQIGAALAALGPVGLIVAGVALAVAGLAAGLVYLYTQSKSVRDSVSQLGQSIKDNFGKPLDDVKRAFNEAKPVIRDMFEGALKDFVDYLTNHLFPALREAYDIALPKIKEAFNDVVQTYNDHKTELQDLWTRFKQVAGWLTDVLVPLIGTIVGNNFRVLGLIIRAQIETWGLLDKAIQKSIDVIKAVGSAISEAWDWTKAATSAAWTAITSAVSTAWDKIKQVVSTATGAVTGAVTAAWDHVKSATSTAWAAITGAVQTAWDKIKQIVSTVTGAIREIIRVALDIVKQLFQIAWDWVNALTGGRLEALRQTVVSAFTAVRNFIAAALSAIQSAISSAWNAVQSRTIAAWNAIRAALIAAWNAIRAATTAALSAVQSAISSAWNAVQSRTIAAWNATRTAIASAWNAIRSNVTAALSAVQAAVSSAWSAVQSRATAAWNAIGAGIGRAVDGIRNRITSAFHAIPRTIVNALNAVLAGVNWMIGKVNGILPGNPIPSVGSVVVPSGYATGGPVIGPGTDTSDDVVIRASKDEYVLRAKAVRALNRAYGAGFVDQLNVYDIGGDPSAMRIAKKAAGGMVAYASGGRVESVPKPPGYAAGGSVGSVQSFIRSTDPLPYVWGGVGPGGYDCSGLVGEVWARLTGHPSYRRYFTTANAVSAGGFRSGHGAFTIGLSPSHVVGNLSGLAFEAASTRSGIKVGGAAKSVDAMPAQYYLPQVNGQFVGGGGGASLPSLKSLISKLFDTGVAPLRAALPRPGGFVDPLVTGLFDQAIGGLKSRALALAPFDEGGILPPGPTLALNTTRRNEQVLSPEQVDRLAAAAGGTGGTHYHFAEGAITLDASKIRDVEDLLAMIDGLKATARQYGARR